VSAVVFVSLHRAEQADRRRKLAAVCVDVE
jgi:hypothetical protein